METKISENNVEELLALSQVYQFLSTCLFEPKQETLELLNNREYMDEVESCLGENGNDELLETFRHLQEGLQDANVETLMEGYRDTFGGATVSMDCPPFEMYFSGSHIWQQTQDLADISGFYKAYGLEVSEEGVAIRWDHISVELEFLHFLTYKLAYAIEHHGEEEQELCLTAKKKFLNAHIGIWVHAFSKAVWRKSPLEFYKQVAKLANDVIHLDMEKLDVDAEEIDEYQGNEPDYLQRLEGKSAMACDSCMDEEKYD
jgi:TorA maturation chaperone TorD